MCVLISSCCSRNAHTSRLYLKNSHLKISTQDIAKPFLVARNSTMRHWFRSFIRLSGVRVVWYAKCSGAEGGVSCCLFSRRGSEVALDFKECFQTKLGFFSQEHFAQCSLCHPHLLYPPNTWKPSLLLTLLLLSNQQLLPSTEIFPLSLRSCASFHISRPDVLFSPIFTFRSDTCLHHYWKTEMQNRVNISFIFYSVIFISMLNLQFRHRRFIAANHLEVWLKRNLQEDSVLRIKSLRYIYTDKGI